MVGGEFVRVVSRREVVSLAFGAMVGWSWVALSGEWIAGAGSAAAMLAFVIGGVAVILVGFTYAELASAMPRAGGEHVYAHRALGPLASFVCSWSILLAYVSVVAFEAVALPTVLDYLLPGFGRGYLWTVAGWEVTATWVVTGVAAAVMMTTVNLVGIKGAARLQLLVTAVILVAGFALLSGATVGGDVDNMAPLFHNGTSGLLGVLVMVPFMFVGFDVIPQSAEEADMPFRDLGRMLMLSIVMAVFWYTMIIWAVAMSMPETERAGSSLPTADAAAKLFGGSWAGKLLVIGGIGGILTSWNAFLIGGSRLLYALGKSGQLPRAFGTLHPTFNTPHRAILLIGGLSVVSPLFGRPALVWLVDAGGLGVVVAYAFVALSFLVLRRREPALPRPYRVRHWRFVGGAAFVLSVALSMLYLPFSPAALLWPYEWAIVIAWCALGAVLLFGASR